MKFRDWLFLMCVAFGSSILVLWLLMVILSKTGLIGLAITLILFGGGMYGVTRWADKVEETLDTIK